MTVTQIGPKHQITIPQEVFEQLGLEPGDFLEVQVREEALYLVPQKLVPREQAWFWSKESQEREQEADAAIAQGELSGPFESVDDLMRHLKAQ
ncbi:MAG: AbrB/MazE/SpoVT family DNA-binding domain-containing protein [SAR202 cluster bacterium]|nr:AbrB/MazE/SpoVT family DNA-binding domain-containing protein [SAR202 cluster bacterium]